MEIEITRRDGVKIKVTGEEKQIDDWTTRNKEVIFGVTLQVVPK